MKKQIKQPFKLGITGGIGSGKTSVCKVFEVLGIPVFSSDQEARQIMENDTKIVNNLNLIAGKNLYISGCLDREELGRVIFNDRALLEKVNSLVHPVVFDHFNKWAFRQAKPYVIMEAAILFESGASKFMDWIATVVAPVEQRIARVAERNNFSTENVMERIRNQMDDMTRIRLSDYVISNSENDMVIPAILKIHNKILETIKTRV